jgi:hypothetical protein
MLHHMAATTRLSRGTVVAIVGGLSAVGGVIAGGLAALVGAAVLTPTEPLSAARIASMAAEYGVMVGVAGAVVGTIAAFGPLRRVPLGRLLLCTNVGLAVGLIASWLGGPWAWNHMGLLGGAGFTAGAVLARSVSRGSTTRVPSADREFAAESERTSSTVRN